jgi:hypothetical protein
MYREAAGRTEETNQGQASEARLHYQVASEWFRLQEVCHHGYLRQVRPGHQPKEVSLPRDVRCGGRNHSAGGELL